MDFLILKKQYPLFAQTAGFFVLSIYDHGYIKADQRWNFNSVCSPFNRLYLICAGQARVRNKNQDILLKKNTAFLIPAGSENSYSCDSFLEKFYLHFRMELIPGRDIFENTALIRQSPLDTAEFKRIRNLFYSEKENLKSALFLQAYLTGLIGTMVDDSYTAGFSYSEELRPVTLYIDAHARADLCHDILSEIAGKSAAALYRDFRKNCGVSMKKYIQRRIVQRAREYLVCTDRRIKEVAFELGYTDEFYFSRFFHKQTGFWPKEYRLKNKINGITDREI